MGHEHERAAEIPVERDEELDDLLARGRVEVARGLVGQEQPRPAADGARDGDPLLLAARELDGVVVAAIGETDLAEQRVRAAERVGLAAEPERHRDVLERGERCNEVVGLEDIADIVPPEAREIVLAEPRDLHPGHRHAARGGLVETGDEAQQC